jgi:4-amino-4-deoxy-L-arabinose transferase-like glycosyltransferase
VNTFYRCWTFSLIIKLLVAAILPFSSDEAYYWVWSNHLDLGYFDHPAMIAWLNSLGHILDPVGLRWPAVILGHLSWIAWYQIFKERINLPIWCALMLLNPLFGWGSFLAIPDTPATFFWAFSALAALKWFEQGSIKWAILLGLCLGLGFNTKYHIVLFVPALIIWLSWIKGWGRIKFLHVPAIIAVGLAACAPVLIWNFNHNFDSFFFQLGHGLQNEEVRWVWPLEYLGSQIGLLFPTILLLCLRPPSDSRAKFLYVLGWFPIFFFFLTSFRARPEGNWPILGYAAILTLAALQDKWRTPLKYTIGIWAFAFVAVTSEALFQWVPMKNKDTLKTFEANRYDVFIPWLESDIPVYASSFQMAATLNFKTRKPVYKFRTLSRPDFYDYILQSLPPPSGRFMILANRETDYSNTLLGNGHFKLIEEKHFTPDKKVMIYEVVK